jgi:hypothetical protein
MLEHARVARHQRGSGEPEDLPQREVPGHDREHDAEGHEGHVAAGGVRRDHLGGEEPLGVLRVVVAHPRALLGFRPSLGERLAHLHGHEARELVLPLAEPRRRAPEGTRALRERRAPPSDERGVRFSQDARDGFGIGLGVLLDERAVRGVEGAKGHGLAGILAHRSGR